MMLQIEITIAKIIDYSKFPGWVECHIFDAWNNKHTFIEKIPIVTNFNIEPESFHQQSGFIRCKLVKNWTDDNGRKIVTVSTANPDCVETTHGTHELDLLEEQVSSY